MWKELVASVETRGARSESELAALLFRTWFCKNNTGCQLRAETAVRWRNLCNKLTVTLGVGRRPHFIFHVFSVQDSSTGNKVGLRFRLS